MNRIELDPRLRLLSHSSIQSLHSCPRKYQLLKLYPEYIKEESVHTSYGKMFGTGVQALLCGDSLELATLKGIADWAMDLWDTEKEKSFWHCMEAISLFNITRDTSELADYIPVIWNGKPAIELGFCIDLENGFYYRGYIDILLEHKITGELLVVDFKTSGANYSTPATYQNSAQGISYSVVIDTVAPEASGFTIIYFEYLTRLNKFVSHEFYKSYLDRAIWIRDLMLDIDIMKLYNTYESWPKHSNACAAYGRSCFFIDNCTMLTSSLIPESSLLDTSMDAIELDKKKNITYDINVTLTEIINNQINR